MRSMLTVMATLTAMVAELAGADPAWEPCGNAAVHYWRALHVLATSGAVPRELDALLSRRVTLHLHDATLRDLEAQLGSALIVEGQIPDPQDGHPPRITIDGEMSVRDAIERATQALDAAWAPRLSADGVIILTPDALRAQQRRDDDDLFVLLRAGAREPMCDWGDAALPMSLVYRMDRFDIGISRLTEAIFTAAQHARDEHRDEVAIDELAAGFALGRQTRNARSCTQAYHGHEVEFEIAEHALALLPCMATGSATRLLASVRALPRPVPATTVLAGVAERLRASLVAEMAVPFAERQERARQHAPDDDAPEDDAVLPVDDAAYAAALAVVDVEIARIRKIEAKPIAERHAELRAWKREGEQGLRAIVDLMRPASLADAMRARLKFEACVALDLDTVGRIEAFVAAAAATLDGAGEHPVDPISGRPVMLRRGNDALEIVPKTAGDALDGAEGVDAMTIPLVPQPHECWNESSWWGAFGPQDPATGDAEEP